MSERRPKYIQMMSPNQDALVDMLTLARGPIRSWAEYAKDCGVNPSTMSRIINGKLKSPLTIKTLEKLYEHRDEACKVTFDQFIIPYLLREMVRMLAYILGIYKVRLSLFCSP